MQEDRRQSPRHDFVEGIFANYRSRSVSALFEERVRRTPDAVAISFGGTRVTYDELNRRANRLAWFLRAQGIQDEDPVGMLIERSIEAIVVIIAILKAGGAYVPLDAEYPPERIRQIIAQARPLIIFTRQAKRELAAESGVPVFCVEEIAAAVASQSDADVPSDIGAGNLAYIIYTSGTTGEPKGIAGVHASITNGLAWVPRDENTKGEVWCLNLSLSFGASVSRLFHALLCGIPLVVLSEQQSRSADQLVQAIDDHNVTNVLLITPLFREILRSGPAMTRKLGHLRSILLGGSARAPEIVDLARAQLPHARLLDGYAISEIGGPVIVWVIDHQKGHFPGRSFPNTCVHLLDECMAEVPVGEPGEVYISAGHLARGYWRQQGFTAAQFVADPFSMVPGQRMFRTGDIGRWKDDGEFELIGRRDDLVKIRGHRIELGEIEAVLQGHPSIRDAAVGARDFNGDLRLVAYVGVDPEHTLESGDLQRYVGERLPSYMVPSRFLFIDGGLPRTHTGKVDRSALDQAQVCRTSSVSEKGLPSDELENALISIWREILMIDNIGVEDNLLELGGHSLLAIQIAASARDRLGIEIPLESLMGPATITEIAAELRLIDAKEGTGT